MPRGKLLVHLGVGPGVGASHALLDEALRRRARGADVVVGLLDDHGRESLRAMASRLPRVGDGTRLDAAAVLARRPAVVLVDDLAEPAGDGTGRARWQVAEEFAAAGIDVLATADVRTIASLRDAVQALTGQTPSRALPDRVLQTAEVSLVDMTPPALRRRLAHGGLFPGEDLDAARAATFRPDVLAGLRELALGWLAGALPAQHAAVLGRDLGRGTERVLVGLSGGPGTDRVLRRAARLAAAVPGARLDAVHVVPTAGPLPRRVGGEPDDALRDQVLALGGTYHHVVGRDVPAALLDMAQALGATQLVVGSGRTTRWTRAVAVRVLDRLHPDTSVDVHVVADRAPDALVVPAASTTLLPARRLGLASALAVALPTLLVVILQRSGDRVGLAGDALVLLLAVVVVARIGGLWPALLAALLAGTALNYFFIPPLHTLRVAQTHNVITLAVFALVAVLVSGLVHRAAQLTDRATRASAEAGTLSAMAAGVLRGDDALTTLLDTVREAFGMTAAVVLERSAPRPDRDPASPVWSVLQGRGDAPPRTPDEADVVVPAGDRLVLALTGRDLAAADRSLLATFAGQVRHLVERDRLARAAREAERLAAGERLRDALLAAVGHDLRTPLAAARTAVAGLRTHAAASPGSDADQLLATAETSLDRLGRLMADLLDLSRLRAGALGVHADEIWPEDLVAPALDELGAAAQPVTLHLDDDLPTVWADPVLVTRAVVNVVANAIRHSPPGRPPSVRVGSAQGRVEVRVVDHGPGLPPERRPGMFTPLVHLGGDTAPADPRTGLGLGLALSRGLVEAMEGELEMEDTPGGGLTMVLALPITSAARAAPGPAESR